MLEVRVPCIHLLPKIPKIQIKLISNGYLTAQADQAVRTEETILTSFIRKLGQKLFTFSGLLSHHCEGSEKNFRQSFSLWPA
jgi:hypothetical protein